VLVTVKVAARSEADAAIARIDTRHLRPTEGIRIDDSFLKGRGAHGVYVEGGPARAAPWGRGW